MSDQAWVEECQRHFEGVRTNYRESGFPDLPSFVVHEIWKRDPRVEAERERIMREVVRPLVEALGRLGIPRSDGSRCFCAATLLHRDCEEANEALGVARQAMEPQR